MGIDLDVVGQTIVDDVRQVIDIQSTCCHISGDKQLQVAGTELAHYQVALLLRQVAMQRVAVVALVHQVLGNLLCLQFGATEDDAVDARIKIHNALQGSILVLGMHQVVHVVHVGCTFILVTDGDLHRIVHIILRNLGNGLGHGGTKEHCAMFLRKVRKDGLDVLLETHRQHLVGLVKHQRLHFAQTHCSTVHKVNQSAWCSHNHMHTALQCTNLTTYRRTTIYGQDSNAAQVFRIVLKVGSNLKAKFTRRSQHQRLWLRCILGVHPFARLEILLDLIIAVNGNNIDALQQGKAEGSGLARTRLGKAYHVASFFAQDDGNDLLLNGHRVFVAKFLDGTKQGILDAEFFERRETARNFTG